MLTYLSSVTSLYRDLGQRKGAEESVPNPKADLKLFNSIKVTADADFEADEAAYAIEVITRQRISDCIRDGQTYIVTLDTLFCSTTHTLGIPFQKDDM